MTTPRKNRLVGPVIALRTFRTDDGKLNLKKQEQHLRWLIDQGITEGNGVIMGAGGGGEGYFMSNEEWQAIVELTAAGCKGRVPSMAGIFELSATEAAKKAVFCEGVGIDFVQVQPPHYLLPTNEEVFYHFKAINDAANVGIVCYNAPWAMPRPGYDLKPPLLQRLLELKHVEGVKWFSYDAKTYVECARLFSSALNFINNGLPYLLSLPIKLGMTGFINSDGNCAPRLVLHLWELWKNKRYEDYDSLMFKLYVDPYLQIHVPEEAQWVGMGEGPFARLRMEFMGCKMGPSFPAQQPLSQKFVDNYLEGYRKSGIAKWVSWKE